MLHASHGMGLEWGLLVRWMAATLAWFGLMVIGVIIALPYKNTEKLAKLK